MRGECVLWACVVWGVWGVARRGVGVCRVRVWGIVWCVGLWDGGGECVCMNVYVRVCGEGGGYPKHQRQYEAKRQWTW